MKYVLGVDFGGGACKATLLSADGKVAATASSEYPTFYGASGMAEQNPDDWYEAACKNIRALCEKAGAGNIEAVCFDAATHTAVLLGGDGKPVRNSVYWTDTRSKKQVDYLSKFYCEKLLDKCKHSVDTIWTLPQLMFVKENFPDDYAKVKRVTFAKDYVRGRFTGDFATDSTEAQGSMLFDFDKKVWVGEFLSLCSLSRDNVPSVVSPLDLAGTVNENAARDSGLKEGTPVICGCTDTAMEVYAAAGADVGAMTLKLATAGRICVISDKYFPDKNIINYSHLESGLYYPGSATKSCAASLRWFRDTFGGDYGEFSAEAAKINPGCDGLIFHPYLSGELTPYANPALRGSFVGVSAMHTKAHFTRAVMEGVAMSLKDCFEYLKAAGISLGGEAYVIGGGAKSDVWRSIVADALGLKLIRTRNNDSSYGSALCASVAAGFFAGLAEASEKCREVIGETLPDPEKRDTYERIYTKYVKISKFLTELSHE